MHSEIVSRTKINLNLCTASGASDRIYKVLGAGGFLLTNDWDGREEMFKDGKEIVIYQDAADLNDKIKFFLANQQAREEIANNGHSAVQKYNRRQWAKHLVKYYGMVSDNEIGTKDIHFIYGQFTTI